MAGWFGTQRQPDPPPTPQQYTEFLDETEELEAALERTERIITHIARIVAGIAFIGGAAIAGVYLYRETAKASAKADVLARKTRGRRVEALVLNSYEQQIVDSVVDPDDIEIGFDDIGGLARVKRELRDIAVLPMRQPGLFKNRGSLLRPPKGILLYGAPGTGKTMLAKALAKESGAAFIAINASDLMSKWFGESQSKVRAVFTLASKLSPCIIFIDEIDAMCGARNGEDHTALNNMKAELMSAWDGFSVASSSGSGSSGGSDGGFGHGDVVVVGASNRPYDVDTAILRRMPRQFEIGLPDEWGREMILKRILIGEGVDAQLARAVQERGSSAELGAVAAGTHGFSGSDLKELCRAAALLPLQQHIQLCRIQAYARSRVVRQRFVAARRRQRGRSGGERRAVSGAGKSDAVAAPWLKRSVFGAAAAASAGERRQARVRPVAVEDLLAARRMVRATGGAAAEYAAQSGSDTSVRGAFAESATGSAGNNNRGGAEAAAAAAMLMQMMQFGMQQQQQQGSGGGGSGSGRGRGTGGGGGDFGI